jgi:hypothetical protein
VPEIVANGSIHLATRLHCVAPEHDLDAIRAHGLHLAARAVLTILGGLLLWSAPLTVTGLVVMLIGLIFAVSGLLAGDFVPDAVDALSERFHGAPTRRAS